MSNMSPYFHSEDALDVMREIAANPRVTQRDLSARLELSLGKINFLVHALCEKGLVKVEHFRASDSKAAYLYQLTPEGVEERLRLTMRFLKKKAAEYERLQKDLRDLQSPP